MTAFWWAYRALRNWFKEHRIFVVEANPAPTCTSAARQKQRYGSVLLGSSRFVAGRSPPHFDGGRISTDGDVNARTAMTAEASWLCRAAVRPRPNHHAAVRTNPSAVKRGSHLLAFNAGNENASSVSSDMAGVAGLSR
jgi:hypothetical protein